MKLEYKTTVVQGTENSCAFYAPQYPVDTKILVYTIKGSLLETDLYKQDLGSWYNEDLEGNALWFTTHNRISYTGCELLRTDEGAYVADTKVKVC